MLGIGIIGAGDFGGAHARALREVEGVRLVASCRENGQALDAFMAKHGGRGYSDWRAVLDDRDIDAVVIATPHALHAEMAIGAAQAGKHILLEKPMAPTVEACDRINAGVAAAGVKLMVAHLVHFSRPCMAAKQVLEEGALGKPLIASSWMIKLWMEHNRRSWHLGFETGGGMLMTAGIHALDRLLWLMDDEVEAVSAMLGAKFHAQEADDTALIGLRFRAGGFGQVQSVGYRDGAVSFAIDLVCEGGTLKIDMDRGTFLGRGTQWSEELPGSFEPNWMHEAVKREWTHFRDAVLQDSPVPVTGDYGRKVIAVIEAAYRANKTRREERPA